MKRFSLFILIFGMLCTSPVLRGQSLSGDSVSNNLISADSVSENIIHKQPELKPKSSPQIISPMRPPIPVDIPNMKLLPAKYWGYDSKNIFRYSPPPFDPAEITLNLEFAPPKSIIELIKENPFRAAVYGTAILAGKANNILYGEDKMTTIRVNHSVQSHSGIPETARPSGISVNYEINIKKQK
jgi:hypothetical protein